MGSYDDEKKGGIFPTHTGPHIGTSKARGMLDNIGGSAGAIRTQQWIQPDGSTTRLKTKDGMPEFITEKRNSAMAVCSDKFFGIPTSSDHELGYTPNGYVGPVCVWKLWPKFTQAPDSPEELVPIAPLTTTVGLDTTDNMPGCVTWFSELAKADGKPIVVSWAGPAHRAGSWLGQVRPYDRIHGESFDEWGGILGNSGPGKYNLDNSNATDQSKEYYGDSRPEGAFVWLNGTVRVECVGKTVSAAALRKVTADSGDPPGWYLYIITPDRDVFRKRINLTEMVGDTTVIYRGLNGSRITGMGLVGAPLTTIGHVSGADRHAPRINASCTKAVFVIQANHSSPNPDGSLSPHPSILEVDLDTMSDTPVMEDVIDRDPVQYQCQNYGTQSTDMVPPSTDGYWIDERYQNVTNEEYFITRDWAVAADYKGDDLVYLYSRKKIRRVRYWFITTKINNGYHYSNYPDIDQSQTVHDYISKSLRGMETVYSLEHSTLGAIDSFTIDANPPRYEAEQPYTTLVEHLDGATGIWTRTPPGGLPPKVITVEYNNYLLDPYPNSTTGRAQIQVYNVDLRHDAFIYAIDVDIFKHDSGEYWNGVIGDSWSKKYIQTKGVLFGQQIFDSGEQPSLFNLSWYDYDYLFEEPYAVPYTDEPTYDPAKAYIYFSGNNSGIIPRLRQASSPYGTAWPVPYCHLTISPRGEAAYVDSICPSDNRQPRFVKFFLDGVLVDPAQEYAPPTFPTISGGIFCYRSLDAVQEG